MDPYQILGVAANAPDDEIKKAYRKLVKEFHPDKNNSEEARSRVRLINAAYEILSDPVNGHSMISRHTSLHRTMKKILSKRIKGISRWKLLVHARSKHHPLAHL